jgi:recombination protein RecA
MPTAKTTGDPLEDGLRSINRDIGANTIYYLGDSQHLRTDVIPTGSPMLDLALGIGGIPLGRITEIYGPESSGKTTLCQHLIANVQKAGGVAAMIDAEHALDPEYARKCGVDIDTLLMTQPDTGEDALKIADILVRTGKVKLIVIDSVAMLVPRAELEGDIGDAHMGLQARLMGQGMRKLAGPALNNKCAIVFTNQLRDKIGVIFGSPETTTGGKALKFATSIRLDIRRIESLKKGDVIYGNRARVKVVKNKLAPPYRQAEFDILFDRGIDYYGSLVDAAVSLGILRKNTSYFYHNDTQIGHGADQVRDYFVVNQSVASVIDGQIRTHIEETTKPPDREELGERIANL